MPSSPSEQPTPGNVRYEMRDGGCLWVHLAGDWDIRGPTPEAVLPTKALKDAQSLQFDTTELGEWDTRLLAFLDNLSRLAEDEQVTVALDDLPPGARRLLRMASAVPEYEASDEDRFAKPMAALGQRVLANASAGRDMITFLGETANSCWRLATGRAQIRWRDVAGVIVSSGPNALPIVTLISFLVGLILAFVGAIQLRMFGAELFVADLVGIGVIREMGAIMVGVVMAGRTGAAFAAELGTMQVNDEIDALRTMSVSPTDFLVLPRLIGLTLMMPFLCIYADLMGTLGGLFVGVTMLDLGPMQYYIETKASVGVNDFVIGVVMSLVFGALISFSGCYRGMRCGRSSADVGRATTASVVTSIVLLVIATALITYVCDVLGV